jgi:hypothetical protein
MPIELGGKRLKTFREYLNEQSFRLNVPNQLEQEHERKKMFVAIKDSPIINHISHNVKVHRDEYKGTTEYHTLDHDKQETLHYCSIKKTHSPIPCEVQTGVVKHGDLPKHHATNVIYDHFKQSNLPLKTDKTQSDSAHGMWKRLTKRALDDGHHVYYHDGKSLTKLDHSNLNDHLDKYFEDDIDSDKHIILSKDTL